VTKYFDVNKNYENDLQIDDGITGVFIFISVETILIKLEVRLLFVCDFFD